MVDILCGALSGATGARSPPLSPCVRRSLRVAWASKSAISLAPQIGGFIEPDEFKRQIDKWSRTFRATKSVPGTPGVLVPGDPERQAEAIRSKEGIPLVAAVVDDLRDVAMQTGISFD